MAYGNFGGGFGGANMNQILRQAQKMQEDLAKAKKELEETEFVSSVGGGMEGTTLTVVKNGKVYEISASSHSGTASGAEGKIEYMINSSTNEIEITSEENFEDFDSIGISLENLSFEQEIDGKEVSVQFVNGPYGTYSLDFNYYTFGGDGFGL